MTWREYLRTVTTTQHRLDDVSLSYNGQTAPLSPIIKASVLMLEDMLAADSIHNVFVFPEMEQLSKEFLIGKVLHNLTNGRIQMNYDPNQFQRGQHLRYQNCIVKFDRIEEVGGQTYIFVSFSDGLNEGVPLWYAPLFQVIDGGRISTFRTFQRAFQASAARAAAQDPTQNDLLDTLANHRTHLNGSIIYVSTVNAAESFLRDARLNGNELRNILYLAKLNRNGELENISTGQLDGNPAIILAPDLYAVENAINRGVTVQSVIFNASQPTAVINQLNEFTRLGGKDFPIVCITNTANSFELSGLAERDYKIWRWDNTSITEDILAGAACGRIANCRNQVVEYRSLQEDIINEAFCLLDRQKSRIAERYSDLIPAYEKLFSLTMTLLRSVITFREEERQTFRQIIDNCLSTIEAEKRFISEELYNDLKAATGQLSKAIERDYQNQKYEAICDVILSGKNCSVCLVIPERFDRRSYENYWEALNLGCRIKVMYPLEIRDAPVDQYELVILAGWLGEKIMRQVLYSFSARNYLVLTYPREDRWRNSHRRNWNRILSDSGNREIVNKALCVDGRQVSYQTPVPIAAAEPENPELQDEQDTLENLLRQYRFNKYNGNQGRNQEGKATSVDAYPISFVGGYLAFYRERHKALVATEMLMKNSDRITQKLPNELAVGDFVVIREAERDIIRDLADRLLEKDGQTKARELATSWKDALEVALLFCEQRELYDKLCACGCQKRFETVKNWFTDDEMIRPNELQDLRCIANACCARRLRQNVETVYAAGSVVQSAHQRAGILLSQLLKKKLGDYLQELTDIDTWDPITLDLENVGQVKILKITDISQRISVTPGNTNRLLHE